MTSAVWSDKHNEFCVKHRLPASARELWQWILETQAGSSAEVEFNLKSFNAWVEQQRGKPHDVKTVKNAAKRLVDCGAFKDLKCDGFKWSWKRWIIMPINLIVNPIKRRKSSFGTGEVPNLETSKPQSVADDAQTTTTVLDEDLKAKVEACEQAGIRYMGRSASFLLCFTWEQITKAIAFFFASGANNRDKVSNPEGWFRACLQDDYVGQHELRQRENSDDYYSAHSPIAQRQTEEWLHRGCVLG